MYKKEHWSTYEKERSEDDEGRKFLGAMYCFWIENEEYLPDRPGFVGVLKISSSCPYRRRFTAYNTVA